MFLTKYLRCYYERFVQSDKSDSTKWEAWIKEKLPDFDEQVKKSMILNNFMWGVWSIMTLAESDVTNESVFNYFFAEKRIHQLREQRQSWKC